MWNTYVAVCVRFISVSRLRRILGDRHHLRTFQLVTSCLMLTFIGGSKLISWLTALMETDWLAGKHTCRCGAGLRPDIGFLGIKCYIIENRDCTFSDWKGGKQGGGGGRGMSFYRLFSTCSVCMGVYVCVWIAKAQDFCIGREILVETSTLYCK